jgi:hypothetical protein
MISFRPKWYIAEMPIVSMLSGENGKFGYHVNEILFSIDGKHQ